MTSAPSMVNSAPGRSAVAWAMAAWASFVLLPWYKVEAAFCHSIGWRDRRMPRLPSCRRSAAGSGCCRSSCRFSWQAGWWRATTPGTWRLPARRACSGWPSKAFPIIHSRLGIWLAYPVRRHAGTGAARAGLGCRTLCGGDADVHRRGARRARLVQGRPVRRRLALNRDRLADPVCRLSAAVDPYLGHQGQ